MFKVKNTNSEILKAFASLFNDATSHIEEFEVRLSMYPDLANEVDYNENQISIRNDFKYLMDLYGEQGTFSIISERLFKGLYSWLTNNFDHSEVNDQFFTIKEEIISKFKIENSSNFSNYLKFLFYKDGLMKFSSREIKNILVNQHFYGTKLKLSNRFQLNQKTNMSTESINIVEARLKQLKYKKPKKFTNSYSYESQNLSKLAHSLSNQRNIASTSKSYNNNQFKLADIQKSFFITYKNYLASTNQSTSTLNENSLNHYVKKLLQHVAKISDNTFSNKFYTYNDALLIISYSLLKKFLPDNLYLKLLENNTIELASENQQHLQIDSILSELVKKNYQKKQLNKDFSEFVKLLSDIIPVHLVIGKADTITRLLNSAPKKQKEIFIEEATYHFEKDLSYYPLHQVYKDFFVYYFKGYNDLISINQYILSTVKHNMHANHTFNSFFNIFEFNKSLFDSIMTFEFIDIEKHNTLSSSKNPLQFHANLNHLKSETTLSFLETLSFMHEYQFGIIKKT
ncbi:MULTISPECIES: hypothetical protein [Staphylococcaceae]|uniref:hypothetical protein n=1 Tax=Staphylococcaceae TaxID=90964 RepID=UPI000458F278|nr:MULTISPECIES: hypothetical protein [Staphylococcaceae]MCR0730937.1 hypothetical protein [Staphylococcus aureus]HEC2151860.1 hypothetical protein [Staphylococcus delphini]KAH76720.1 hypothetical protein W716_02050 [Staphylococcus aureus VET1865R]MCE5130834.1 hypothetical protein [Staphylococcus saprophyticus]MDG0822729.1 hypothetical protein [Staphylococcus equorum]